jgi:monoamine oxidase
MPGQYTALRRHLVAPEGRLFFAGEHISLTHTWMQGALDSALLAVRDMLASSRG